jgi:hypothetical protein
MSASMPAFQLSLCFSLQSQFYCSISFEFQVVVCVAEASARANAILIENASFGRQRESKTVESKR